MNTAETDIHRYSARPWTRDPEFDITGQVRVSDPQAVGQAIEAILLRRHPDLDRAALARAMQRFHDLYAGLEPGYAGVDTPYHDVQHSLECALAMARLLDGEAAVTGLADPRRALLGIACALFHDAGYIRRDGDTERHGAELTLRHVHRSGEYLARVLPDLGLEAEVEVARLIVHYTGYELALDDLDLPSPHDRRLGQLLGTADIVGQSADACYLEKCQWPLYDEFALCGLAGPSRPGVTRIYASREDLMRQTPEFQNTLRRERLGQQFGGCWRVLDAHFGAANPYLPAIDAHVARVTELIARDALDELRGPPRAVLAADLRDST